MELSNAKIAKIVNNHNIYNLNTFSYLNSPVMLLANDKEHEDVSLNDRREEYNTSGQIR